MGKLKTGERKRPGGGYEKRFTIDGVRYSVYAERKDDLQAKEDAKQTQIRGCQEFCVFRLTNRI